MASCLGIYIEDKLIKYAKVSKSNDAIKVESFGMKFYDNIENTIKQIIEETYSFKTPISINLSDEKYNKMEVFSLLSKKDMDGVIKSEFENICYSKEENPYIYEQRYIPASLSTTGEKIGVVHISSPKTSIEEKKNQFLEHKISKIVPIGISIVDILKREKKKNTLVVNIEKNTVITKVYDNMISDVVVLPLGAQNIIDNINRKENSYSKAYEICKNSTIYNEQDKYLEYEENEYLVDIMPVLFKIVTEVRNIIENSLEKIEKVYITGTASVINNIDIYFEEYLQGVQCEILKPAFIKNNSKINIKDYIEVNSAISLALQGLEKNSAINFIKESSISKTGDILKKEITLDMFKSVEFSEFLEGSSRKYNMAFIIFLLLTLFYLAGSFIINKQLDKRLETANTAIENTNNRIEEVKSYNEKLNEQISEYEELIKYIDNVNDISSEDKRYRNTIPNLLNNVMAIIPRNVQLISIQNTSGSHIVIVAKTQKTEQMAFFKTKLKTEKILKKVVSNTGEMKDGYLTVTIEGELP